MPDPIPIRLRLSVRTRGLMSHYAGKDPGRTFNRSMQLGLEFMWIPPEDFARVTQTHARNNGAQHSWFLSADQREKFLTLEGDGFVDDELWARLRPRIYQRGFKILFAHELDFEHGWTVALRYGLVAYKTHLAPLRESLGAYGKDSKVPAKLLSDGQTYGGQAHLGGTGPDRARCRNCNHFDPKVNLRGQPTQGRCAIWAELMGVPLKKAPLFPVEAKTCKYFEEGKT